MSTEFFSSLFACDVELKSNYWRLCMIWLYFAWKYKCRDFFFPSMEEEVMWLESVEEERSCPDWWESFLSGGTESKFNSILLGTGPGPVREVSPLLSLASWPPLSRAGFGPDQRLLGKVVFGQACNLKGPLGTFSLSYLCWAAKTFTWLLNSKSLKHTCVA